jgi:putative oxidoreductase
MKVLVPTKIARYVFALVIAFFGSGHLMNAEMMATMAPFGGIAIIYITGVALVLAAVSFIIGKQVRLAGYLLAVFLILTAFLVQMMGMMGTEDEMMKMSYMTMIVKDLALAAGSVAFANAADS